MIQYPNISLCSVYDNPEPTRSFFYRELYYILQERKPEENISHKIMPSWQEHVTYIEQKPHKEWFLILNSGGQIVGNIYISKNNEIGVGVFADYRNKKYASAAIYAILENYPNETFFANINPQNEKSIELFKQFGFEYIQNTYRREPIGPDVLVEVKQEQSVAE